MTDRAVRAAVIDAVWIAAVTAAAIALMYPPEKRLSWGTVWVVAATGLVTFGWRLSMHRRRLRAKGSR